MDKIKYQLVKDTYENLNDDLTKLVSMLNTTFGVKAERNVEDPSILNIKNHVGDKIYKAVIEVSEQESQKQPLIILNSEPIDNVLPNVVKICSSHLGFRLFSQSIGSFLPRDPNLLDITAEIVLPEASKVLRARNFRPVFVFRNSAAIYAESLSDHSVHFINEYILNYYMKFGFKEDGTYSEFSYKVAPNVKMFIPLYDSSLVPSNFYSYYKKPLKIINYSSFNIENPNRKIFIQPLLFELNEPKQQFIPIASRGSAALIADKIRTGENLDAALKRYLQEQVGIHDYIGAVAHRNIEFDRDKEGKLTPRLIVNVFVENIVNRDKFEEKAQRGWTSIN